MSTKKDGYIELEEVNGVVNHTKYGSNSPPGSVIENGSETAKVHSDGLEDHCHSSIALELDSISRKTARKKLIYASIVCILFIAIEVTGGILAGSLAILTDAAHLLSDFSSFLISYFALILADKRPSKRLTWGWHRAEILGALLSVMMIWAITAVLVVLAIFKIVKNTYSINAKIMMITAGFAIFANVVMLLVLHNPCSGHGHSHGGHGHSHGRHDTGDKHNLIDQEEGNGKKGHTVSNNVNVRAAILHVIGDFFQSLAVFIAAVIIYVKPEYKLADPICTFVFSILVLGTTITISKDIVNVLMEAKPEGIDFPEVSSSIRKMRGVRSLHDLRIWMITTEVVACSVHVTIDDANVNQQTLLNDVRGLMRHKYGISDCTVQIEEHKNSMDSCDQCVLPGEKK
ncbi:proton-coupled zinc antiporter SLC30A2-like [Antedon mediterranea]|uniref:proton-coupled zinc antiporter SLC30A2-like n=1 Tax=Antedon mediterranea TaxID=105859 RepID=UPI003AF573F5